MTEAAEDVFKEGCGYILRQLCYEQREDNAMWALKQGDE